MPVNLLVVTTNKLTGFLMFFDIKKKESLLCYNFVD